MVAICLQLLYLGELLHTNYGTDLFNSKRLWWFSVFFSVDEEDSSYIVALLFLHGRLRFRGVQGACALQPFLY